LHGAFGQGRLYPAFQPQIDLETGKLIGFEALMRWRTADNTFISPDKFIPLAEQSGLIVGMGTWILRESLRFIRQLELAGWQDLCMSVNVSAVQFRRADFLETLQHALLETKANPNMLELEITESVAMMGQTLVANTLHSIRAMGIGIAIDDFGTGFSSLSYLNQLPLDRLKIDRSFVINICDNEASRITDLIIQLGRNLGLRVIAEGVEYEAQAVRLLEMGCGEAQGYFYGYPMLEADLMNWLGDWKTKHALTLNPTV
jgi:EAL domain-containing protein (putative c-di-GMP-specific phosphodiesterase class I)